MKIFFYPRPMCDLHYTTDFPNVFLLSQHASLFSLDQLNVTVHAHMKGRVGPSHTLPTILADKNKYVYPFICTSSRRILCIMSENCM